MNDLLGLDPGKPEFEELLGRFVIDGRAHISFEENEVWPGFRKALSPEEANELGEKLEQGKKMAPTRPHPHTPPKPGILKATGPVVSAADKARDKITGRDEE